MKVRKILIGVVGMITLMVAGCAVSEPTKKVKAMQRKDKRLSCQEILLEMNEAEFYKRTAYKSKGPKIQNVLMPLGYISTYLDANEAIDAANARVEYLDRVYEIMRCDEQDSIPTYE